MEILENAGRSGSKIMGSLKSIISDAEKVLENSTAQGSESYQNAKKKLESTISDAKFVLRELNDVVVTKAKDAAVCTAEFAKENPWKTVGIVAAVSVLVGVLIARSRK
ncbi:DUF883 family protein [Oxalobacter aliiformigenes]|uniref:DUF883 family protein n=1 Tax=Oxalobacter aliiformigenes TaxID=2946593 RepID=UPI0022AEF9BF|nr:DUF883 family protein [Oxalobacter aliiformigenes]MCZ4064895.1 DUF883 family protein [Oxalobacter aliiformigenes]WAV99005.1 DUF883 family protein [Oxalobacter aliiformigenes]